MTPEGPGRPDRRVDLHPSVDEAFRHASSSAGRVLVCDPLARVARHLFTTRQHQFRNETLTGDYAKLAAAFDVGAPEVVRVRQVHGAAVLEVHPGNEPDVRADADAVVCLDPARVASVRVADCVPILMADRGGRLVAAVHAGWRGTAAGVARATVETIGRHGVRPVDLVAAIGPCAGPCCYQVDEVVRGRFADLRVDAHFIADGARWRLDLAQVNRACLIEAGLPPTAIHVAGRCTIHEADTWHSHRRDGATAGRMVAAIRVGAGDPMVEGMLRA